MRPIAACLLLLPLLAEPSPSPSPSPSPADRGSGRPLTTAEHRKLQFLIGEWSIEPASSDASAWKGSLQVRWDMGGLLLVERWSLNRGADIEEARQLWAYEGQGRFRAFRFDSAGAIGEERQGRAGDKLATLERSLHEGETTLLERTTYTLERAGEKSVTVRLRVRTERGPAAGPLAPVEEFVLVKNLR